MIYASNLVKEGKIDNLYDYLREIESMFNFKRDTNGNMEYYDTDTKESQNKIKEYYNKINEMMATDDEKLKQDEIDAINRSINDYAIWVKEYYIYLEKLKVLQSQFDNWNPKTTRGIKYKDKIYKDFVDEINTISHVKSDYEENIENLKKQIETFNVDDYKNKIIEYYNNRIKNEMESIESSLIFRIGENSLLHDYENSLNELKEKLLNKED